jgi:death-on-curing protein
VSEGIVFLDLEDALLLCERLGVGPVRDLGLLGSALDRPRTTLFGADAYPDLPRKAAALVDSVVRNHALVDGNKRLGWMCLVVFLDLNGIWLEVDDDEAFDLVMAVAGGTVPLEDLGRNIARWIAEV